MKQAGDMINESTTQMVSSRSIALMAGKSHAQVISDLGNLWEVLEDDASTIHWGAMSDLHGCQHRTAFLPKDLAYKLMSHYDHEIRSKFYGSPMLHAMTKYWVEQEVVQIEAALNALSAYSESGKSRTKKTTADSRDVKAEAVDKLIQSVSQMLEVMYEQSWIERDVY